MVAKNILSALVFAATCSGGSLTSSFLTMNGTANFFLKKKSSGIAMVNAQEDCARPYTVQQGDSCASISETQMVPTYVTTSIQSCFCDSDLYADTN